MRSRQLETSLTEFFGAASAYLRAEVAAGAEVPFELGAQTARRGGGGTPLYTYRALTGQFISERDGALNRPHPFDEHVAGWRCAAPKIGSELSWFADKFSFAPGDRLATRKFGAIGRVGAS